MTNRGFDHYINASNLRISIRAKVTGKIVLELCHNFSYNFKIIEFLIKLDELQKLQYLVSYLFE